MNKLFSSKRALALAFAISSAAVLVLSLLNIGEKSHSAAIDQSISPTKALAPIAGDASTTVETSPPDLGLSASPARRFAWFQSISEQIVHQSSVDSGPYRVETTIARTRFHRPLLRLDRTYYGQGHIHEGELVKESLSIANEFIVAATANSRLSEIERVADALGAAAEPLSRNSDLFRFHFPETENLAALPQRMASLGALPEIVRYVEADQLLRRSAFEPNDPRFPLQYNLSNPLGAGSANRDIDAPQAWDTINASPEVVIAIIDTGIRATHEDLKDNLWRNEGELANGLDDDGNGIIDDLFGFNAIEHNGDPNDDNGHGTHVAGIAAARGNNSKGIAGVTWDAQLMPLKFLDETGYGTISDAIKCIDYAITNGADIINNSWGGSENSEALYETLTRASDAGTLIVSAAGNESLDLDETPTYPAAYQIPNQVTVVATENYDTLSFYSNYSPRLAHIAAPARAISAFHTADDAYAELEGTSMAAPLVAGSLALIKAKFPKNSAEGNLARLLNSVELRTDLSRVCLSSGRLNVHRAVTGASNAPVNDTFAQAEELSSLGGRRSGSLSLATRESGEPLPAPNAQGATVWYIWTPHLSGVAQIKLSPTGFAGALSIFQGSSLSNIQLVDTSSSTESNGPIVLNWEILAHQTYFLQIDSVNERLGPFSLELVIAPPNDAFDNATILEGSVFTVSGRNTAASLEQGETPLHPSATGASVWYRWKAPQSGSVYLKIAQTSSRLFTRVFTGEALATLSPLEASFESGSQSNLVFQASAGVTYAIAVDSLSALGSDFHLEGSYIGAPRILVHPKDQSVELGDRASFSVVAVGDGVPSYQWFKDGAAIQGATRANVEIPAITKEDLGSYSVELRFPNQTLRSRSAVLSLFAGTFQFIRNPAPASIKQGQSVTLSALLNPGSGTPDLQWLKDGEAIPGANDLTLSLQNAKSADSGFYQLRATKGAASVLSEPAYLVVSDRDEFYAYAWTGPSSSSVSTHGLKTIGNYFVTTRSGPFSFSLDGRVWQTVDIESRDITWNGDFYTLISDKAVYTSPNLLHWTKKKEFEKSLYSIAYGAGNYTIRAADGIYHSTDASSWTKTLELTGQWGETIAFGNGLFVAARFSAIYSSPDGITWSSHSGPTGQLTIAQYGDGRWWLYGYADVETLWVSKDARNWTTFPFSQDRLDDVVIDEDQDQVYLLLETLDNEGLHPPRYRLEVYRVDGESYEYRKFLYTEESPWTPPLTFKDGEGIISTNKGVTPLDELTSLHFDNQAQSWYSNATISYANDRFIASSGRWLYSSGDGANWTREASNTYDHGYGRFVYGNGVYLSENHVGSTLSSLSKHSVNLESIVFEENRFVAISWPDGIKHSTDAKTWNSVSGINATHLVYGKGVFVAYSEDDLYTSEDGIQWTEQSLPEGARFSSMVFGNDTFLAFAQNKCYTSSDGKSWQRKANLSLPNHSSDFVYKVHFIDGEFLALYWDDYYFTSSDGDSWKQIAASPTLVNNHGSILSNAAESGQAIVTSSERGIAILGHHRSNLSETSFVSHPSTMRSQLGAPLDLRFLASAPIESIDRTELLINGELWETLPANRRAFRFTPETAGQYLVEVVTYTKDGNRAADSIALEVPPLLTVKKPSDEFSLNDLIFHHGAYYGVSDGGRVHLSTNGIDWKTLQTPSMEPLTSIAANPSGFVAGYQGKGALFSHDGIHWIQTGNFDSDGVVCENGLFIAGLSWAPMLSRDGINWFPAGEETISVEPDSRDLVFNAFDQSFVGGLGRSWTRLENFSKVYQVGDTYVGLGYYEVSTSRNLEVWSALFPEESAYDLRKVGDLLFLETSSGYHYTADGETWFAMEDSFYGQQISYSDGYYYTFTTRSGDNPFMVVLRSRDAIDWEQLGEPIPFEGYAFRIGPFVASPSGLAFTANDGSTYSFVGVDGSLYSQTFDSFGFRENIAIIGIDPVIAVTDYQSYFRNSGGQWQRTKTRVEENTVFASGVYLGDWHFGLHRSVDGVNWTKVAYPEWLTNVYFDIEELYSDGDYFWLLIDYEINRVDHTAYARSKDGLKWERIDPQDDQRLFDKPVSFKGSIYSHWGESVIRLSNDFTRSSQVLQASGSVQLAATDTRLGALVGSYDGTSSIRLSSDGESWQSQSLPITGYLTLAATNDAFYLAGESVWTSSDGLEWEQIIPYPAKVATFEDHVVFYTDNLTFIEPVSRDLSIRDLVVSNVDYGVGDRISFRITLQNNGQDTLQLAKDSKINYTFAKTVGSWTLRNESDGFGGSATIPFSQLAPSEARAFTIETTVPEGISPSQYYLSARFPDGIVAEDGNTSNDFYVASETSQITVPGRDLAIDPSPNGQVIGARDGQEFAWKDKLRLKAQPDFGYEFRGWAGDKPYGDAFYLLTLDEDTRLAPLFTPRVYKVSLNIVGEGAVDGLPDSSTFDFGQTLNLTAAPADGWIFLGWEGYGKEKSQALTATVGRDLALTARFGRTFSSWAEEKYPENEADRAMLADPDGDGFSNLEHFALGLDHRSEAGDFVLGWSYQDKVITLRYATYSGLANVEVGPEWTEDGATWHSSLINTRTLGQTESLILHEATLSMPASASARFLGLKVSSDEAL
ncbi:S8 family serine peptidase [Pelagicoccus sp. SDUM812003]|uniref:S8 family serine peptidase n=1 Tax=Pelagicoccus sp. SDUM812003 TaxID=3041267 RepID=UPI0028104179|nr:S8 family serine peptidase [Pelagicoccus sp. SDUM812003]MDQ8203399.1 S8 family serine peptidase [Pelagicoccus sp. SDUM812003]